MRLKYNNVAHKGTLWQFATRIDKAKEKGMLRQKKIQEMTRREYCSYVQQQYRNDPQWVRTRLISKWDQEHEKKNNEGGASE